MEDLARAVLEALRIEADEHKRAAAFHRRAMDRKYEAADILAAALDRQAGRAVPYDHRTAARSR